MFELENLLLQQLDGILQIERAVPTEYIRQRSFAHVIKGPTVLGSRQYSFDVLYGAGDIPVNRDNCYSVPIVLEGTFEYKQSQWDRKERITGLESRFALVPGEQSYLMNRSGRMAKSYLHLLSEHPKYSLFRNLAQDLISTYQPSK